MNLETLFIFKKCLYWQSSGSVGWLVGWFGSDGSESSLSVHVKSWKIKHWRRWIFFFFKGKGPVECFQILILSQWWWHYRFSHAYASFCSGLASPQRAGQVVPLKIIIQVRSEDQRSSTSLPFEIGCQDCYTTQELSEISLIKSLICLKDQQPP